MLKITKTLKKGLLIALLNLSAISMMGQKQILQEWNFTNNSLASELYNLDFGLPPNTAVNNVDETGGAKNNTYTINGNSGGATTPFFSPSVNSGKFTVSMTIASWSFGSSTGNHYWGISMVDSEDIQIAYFRFITQDKLSSNPPYVGSSLYASFVNPDNGSFNNGGTLKAGVLSKGAASTAYTGTLPVTVNLTIDLDAQTYVVWLGDTKPADDNGTSAWSGRFAQYTGPISFNRTIAGLKWQWGGASGHFIELDRVAIYLGADAALGVQELEKFDFSYFPNPSKDMINLTANDAIESVEIHNMVGQKVIDKTLNMRNPSVDISSLPKGVYIMKVTIGDTHGTYKLVKE